MLYVFGFERIGVVISDLYFIDPNPMPGQEGELEIRPVFELEDFAPGEAVEHHRRVGEEMSRQK